MRLLPWALLSYQLMICVTCTNEQQYCNTASSKCETLDVNREVLNKIERWWEEMAKEKKPVKCTQIPQHTEDIAQNAVPILQSFPCSGNQVLEPYSFKGNIENFIFQGAGKFKIGGLIDSNTDGTCFHRERLAGRNISSVVGNFKDGRPHGVAKIELQDGALYVGWFRDGVRHGFYRYWDSRGRLAELGHIFHGKHAGLLWEEQDKDRPGTIRLTPSFVIPGNNGENHGDPSQVLLFARNFSVALAGELVHNVIARARYAKVEVSGEVQEDCVLRVKWNQLEGEPFKFHPQTGKLRYHQNEPEPSPFCTGAGQQEEWNRDRVDEALKDWINGLSTYSHDGLWQAEPNQESLSDKALMIVDNIHHVDGDTFSCHVLGSTERYFFTAKTRQPEGSNALEGVVKLSFKANADVPKIPLLKAMFSTLEGFMSDGKFEGTVVAGLDDNLFLSAKVKRNVMHGPMIKLGIRPVFPWALEYESNHGLIVVKGLGMAGSFYNGRPRGPFWIGLIGGGYLYGILDESGEFTGEHMAYIYPDMETAIYGAFENKVLKAGRKSRVIAERCDGSGIKVLQFSDPEGPVMFFSPPTNISYGEGPRNMDPYEEKFVAVAPSKISGAGQGVYALRDLQKYQLACVYSGIINRNAEETELYRLRYAHNKSLSDDQRRLASKYSISVGVSMSDVKEGQGMARIEVPIEWDLPGEWMPTSGPKVNSDFPKRRENVIFSQLEHPRYGLIVGVFAKKPIRAGQELFANYAYKKLDFPFDFPWYHEMEKQYLEELKQKEIKQRKQEEKKWKKGQIGKNTVLV